MILHRQFHNQFEKFQIIKYKVPYKILLDKYKALAASIDAHGITSYDGRRYNIFLFSIKYHNKIYDFYKFLDIVTVFTFFFELHGIQKHDI